MTWGSGKARGGPFRGPDVGCMMQDTLHHTVGFPCTPVCPPSSPLWLRCLWLSLPRCLPRDSPGQGGCVVGLGGGGG